MENLRETTGKSKSKLNLPRITEVKGKNKK